MKDFDEMLATDREFTVRGEKFHWRDVRPEVLESFADTTKLEGWGLQDAQILLFIVADEHERYRKLREREEDPVTIAQLNAILVWLMEQATGRPTVQSSPSEVGRGRIAATSKAA